MMPIREMPIGPAKFPENAGDEPIRMSQTVVRLETDGLDERLHLNYVIQNPEPTRKNILLRRACSLIGQEERRLYGLTDQQAIEELDQLKARQDATSMTQA
jgi:hypothetical protein